jgi:hypothetical protein
MEGRAALWTRVLRLGHDQVPWTPGGKITKLMPRALLALGALGLAPTINLLYLLF